MKFLEFANKVDHFDSARSHVKAFVAGFCACPFDGLFDVFRRNDTEENRNTGF